MTINAAFTLSENDRFHSILISSPVKYDIAPGTETILCFFIIRRASGNFDIFHILKTFKSAELISRNVQSKENIPAKDISMNIDNIMKHFSSGIAEHTGGYQLEWNTLNLISRTEKNRSAESENGAS